MGALAGKFYLSHWYKIKSSNHCQILNKWKFQLKNMSHRAVISDFKSAKNLYYAVKAASPCWPVFPKTAVRHFKTLNMYLNWIWSLWKSSIRWKAEIFIEVSAQENGNLFCPVSLSSFTNPMVKLLNINTSKTINNSF